MDFHIETGIFLECKKIVENQDTAIYCKSGSLDVFATPAMIALMENTAMKCVASMLPKGCTTVGMEVNIQHIKASIVGDEVVSKAIVKEVDGRKIVFSIEAKCKGEIIGFGIHTRFIVNSEKFMEKLQKTKN